MENNECNANHLDADVLLPPRKRLLAGMKRQNSDVYSQTPSTSSCGGNDFDTRMNNLLKSHLSSSPNSSNEKIVEASRTAAVEAAKVARAARVVADEKAAIAAKAVAAAKSALELVAMIPDDPPAHQENYLKKNKMKKHVAVQSLYNKQKDTQSCRDEELARKLHQVINSSPRISKNGSTSESKHPKLKKLRISPSEKTTIDNGGPNFEIGRTCNINGVSAYHGNSSSNGVQEKYRARVVDLNTSKFKKRTGLKFEDRDRPKINNSDNQVNRENGNASRVLPEERYGEGDDGGIGRKRMRLKQKKLPLSICNVRDVESPPKEKPKSKNMSSAKDSSFEATTPGSSKPLFPVGPSSDTVGGIDGERSSLWKCQAFKSPASVMQNKVMQS